MQTNAQKVILTLVLSSLIGLPSLATADDQDRRQAKRIHDRLTGVPADNATIDAMVATMQPGNDPSGKEAAKLILNPASPHFNPAFYNVTLKNWAAPWTNEAQDVFVPLNDYTATVIGVVRDGIDFREILFGDVLYRGNTSLGIDGYSNSSNAHYEQLEALGPELGNLADPAILQGPPQGVTQSSVNGLPSSATAGIMTSRAAAMAFFSDGTNRAMFRFTLMNHLCTDLEPVKDASRPTNRIRQDVSRSPGGDSRLFVNNCQGCHSGMDGLAGAYAFYEWEYSGDEDNIPTGQLTYTEGDVVAKHLNNENTFKPGYITVDDSWVNYWRNGQNWLLGWNASGASLDASGNAYGNGAKSMGRELAYSDAFAQCQVDKVFETVCLRDPNVYAADRQARDGVNGFLDNFSASGYDMKEVFADVAAYCKGD